MIRSLAIALALAVALAASQPGMARAEDPAPATAPPPRHLDKCPHEIADYDGSDATADLVKRCLGKPTSEDHNRDGRFVYMYSARGGDLYLAFLFDPAGKLIRMNAYARN